MKKFALLLLLIVSFLLAAASCSSNPTAPDTDKNVTDQTEKNPGTPVPPSNTVEGYDPDDYTFFKVFEAPEGDYRQIVKDYMISMADYKWVAGENFSITWKEQGDFNVKLDFKKGQTYYGLPYSEKRASLDQFSVFVENGGTFISNTYFYEEVIGNHCSSSMGLAYQQLIDFPYAGSLKPVGERRGVIKLIDGLEQPEGDTTKSWYSDDVITLNGQDKIFEAYAKMDTGDILGKFIKTSGHSRMVSKVEPSYTAGGKFVPSRSKVYCIEQTNAFDKTRTDRKTTWWIDHAYTFQDLISTKFIPLTLEIFHNGEELKDAVIMFDAENTPETITKSLSGTVSSNFPLSYVRATVEDSEGNVVGEIYEHKFDKTYKVTLRNSYYKLNIDKLTAGTYKYTLRAGIARGGCDIESFEFTVS